MTPDEKMSQDFLVGMQIEVERMRWFEKQTKPISTGDDMQWCDRMVRLLGLYDHE